MRGPLASSFGIFSILENFDFDEVDRLMTLMEVVARDDCCSVLKLELKVHKGNLAR